MNESNFQSLLNQLEQLKGISPSVADAAEYWINTIREKQKFLDNRAHSIVFIGSAGVGKSSLISVIAHLLIDEKLSDKSSLKKNSVLSIGAGRTTVCEVCIRARQADETGIGLVVEPLTEEEMQKEIALYAETEWSHRQPETVFKGKDDTEPTPQEVQRVIRNMTDYAERQESFMEDNKKKWRTVRPLDQVIPRFDNHETFSAHLLERAKLSERTKTRWWWDENNVENLQALKTLFENINQGKEPTAMLPQRMSVVIPEPLPGSSSELELTLIDTRGLDSPVESRADLYQYMHDPHSIMVLCAPFKDAPGDTLRALLHAMTADAKLREAIPRTLLVLVDQGDAEQVNGADGHRVFGQDLKIDECHRALESAGLLGIIDKERIFAFDALQDERDRLQIAIDHCLVQLRQRVEDEQIDDVKIFIENATNELRPELCEEVDEQLKKVMAEYMLSSEGPLRHPLEGLYTAIQATRYASVVYASCRRHGEYINLNLYAAIRARASQKATGWLDQLINPLIDKLTTLKQVSNEKFVLIHDHISRRESQYKKARSEVSSDYAKRIGEQVEKKLKPDSVWSKCAREWGQGGGFKNKVLSHLQEWERRQQGITAHEITRAKEIVPLLAEMSQPSQPLEFTLYVRHLRVLKRVNWTPAQLSVVIGANGTGKTTLLLVLKFLRVAYQRGLPEAVSQVLGGSSNLKTWGASEEEPLEIGLDMGAISWSIQLVPREGSVDYLTNERLLEQEQEIFSRDGLGAFSYGGERIEPDSKLGLRMLMDRGIHQLALRKVALFLQRIVIYHDPDLWRLRWQGSNTAEDRFLDTRGINALALLRRWYQERVNYDRYQFVVEGLAAAFPNTVAALDFVEAGNTLTARIYRPGQELPSPLASEANGILQLLVLFCEVASAENESVVAIDEPENSLHPYALRAFLRRTRQWARQHYLTVLLATHSTVLLDEMSATPENVYVMKANQPDDPLPTRLDELCNREWLAGFELGDLYEQGEIGSNEDET